MWEFFMEYFMGLGMAASTAGAAAWLTLAAAVALLCMVGHVGTRRVVLRLAERMLKKRPWGRSMLQHRVFHRLAHLVSPLILSLFLKEFPSHQDLLERLVSAYVVLVAVLVADAVLAAVDDIYRSYEISKIRPIKGLLQVVKIVLFIVGGIVLLASLIGKSPLVLLGGISALTAVLMLVFQNPILGFVAGIQLTSNDMVRIGDWIEMPKYDANGTVLEISLCTVKVRNFDNTVTTIPASALVSDSFRNWRGMVESGGRRIMRALHIDLNTVGFCTPEQLERLEQVDCLREYLRNRREEIARYNHAHGVDASQKINGRNLTNLGVFRVYITEYLRRHPGVRQDTTLMVRQLEPDVHGVALQVYAFANTTDWVAYETVQADIFDHLLAVAPEFGLRVYQSPSGRDLAAGYMQKHETA